MPVASGETNVGVRHRVAFARRPRGDGRRRELTCDGEGAGAVGSSFVVLGEAGVKALVVSRGIEDLQSPVEHDGNAEEEREQT